MLPLPLKNTEYTIMLYCPPCCNTGGISHPVEHHDHDLNHLSDSGCRSLVNRIGVTWGDGQNPIRCRVGCIPRGAGEWDAPIRGAAVDAGTTQECLLGVVITKADLRGRNQSGADNDARGVRDVEEVYV